MRPLHSLAAAMVAGSLLVAQGHHGQTSGTPNSPTTNPDGTLGNAVIIHDAPQPGPEVADGSLGGPIAEPQQDGCVSLNSRGGTLDTSAWSNGNWFAHRVVAPRRMRVVSFDFLCRFTSGSGNVNTRLYSSSGGKPNTVLRSGTMSVNTSSGWRRTTLSSGYTFSKNTVFFIAYQVPNSNFRVSLTGGSNGTYYWGSSWSGPFSTRKFAWRINCFDTPVTSVFGTSCNTASTRGPGQGEFTTGLNVDAGEPNTQGWVTNGRFQHRFVAPRDMYVNGASFLCSKPNGASSMTVELWSGTGTSSSPGSLLRSATTTVSTSTRWARACFDTPYFFRRGTVFYIGYITPSSSGLRISTDDGSNTTYYYRSSSSSTFSGPFSSYKFAIRLQSFYAEGENNGSSGADTTSYVRNATFLHRVYADSDQWVSGFGFRCRVASGSSSVNFRMHLSNSSNQPLNGAVRSVTRSVSSSSQYHDVHFTPYFVPRGTVYYIGYTVPSSTSVTFYPAVSGSNAYNTSYYWKSSTATSWSGPFTAKPFNYRVYTSRYQLNPYTSGNATSNFAQNAYFVFRCVAPDNMWVDGCELFGSLSSGGSTMTSVLYTSSGGQPSTLVRTGRMYMSTANTWRKTCFESPYYFAKGSVFFVGVRTPSSGGSVRLRASSGSNATYYWRPATQSSWNGSFTTPVGFKVNGRTGAARLLYSGTAEIGQTLKINLEGASYSRVYGLVLGVSNSQWLSINLPWALPFWSGCYMNVSYDIVLGAGSTGGTGNASVSLPIPNSVSLINLGFYNQFWVLESTGSNLEMSWTNGGYARIGG